MKHIMQNQKNFNLVELIVIVIILGILGMVAVPIYRANMNKAKASEAEAILGIIRTALRVYYAEYQSYPISAEFADVTTISGIDLDTSDLTGKYYVATDYEYKSSDGTGYIVKADNGGTLPVRSINSQGVLADSVLTDE